MRALAGIVVLLIRLSAAAPSSSPSCKTSPQAVDNFDDPSYGAAGISQLSFIGPPPKGTYVTYTACNVGSDAGLNNLPPPSGHNWIGTNHGGLAPNTGYSAFRIYQWKYACTARTLVQDVNLIPSCKITLTCNERLTGAAYRQSFTFAPDSALGLTGHFQTGNFDWDFQWRDLASCSINIDEASKQVAGAAVPLDTSMVVALFDEVVTGGVKC